MAPDLSPTRPNSDLHRWHSTRAPVRYHDNDLETQTVASIISGWATNQQLRPEHLHNPRLQRILTAYLALPQPVEGRHSVIYRAGPNARIGLAIPGIHQHLDARDTRYAQLLAATAPVTTRADVARLRLDAWRRNRLAHIDNERAAILQQLEAS